MLLWPRFWAGRSTASTFFCWSSALRPLPGSSTPQPSAVLGAVFLTQAFRPVGALLFGMLADRYGRRPVLMVNILSFSVIELACAFAPSLNVLLVLRALFGIAMGGEWGVGAALVFETLPKEGRGRSPGFCRRATRWVRFWPRRLSGFSLRAFTGTCSGMS